MMPLSMKTYLALLWGISVLYATESDMNPSTTETSSINSIAEPPKPAEIRVSSPAPETTVETKEAIATYRTEPQWLHTPAAMKTTADATHPSHNAKILETANPAEDQIHQQSPTTSTDMTAPAMTSATASVAAVSVSSQQIPSTTKSEVTSKLPPIASPENVQAPVFNQTHSVPSATTTLTASPTSEVALVFDPTKSKTFPISTELVSTFTLVSVTKTPVSTFPGTAGLSSTTQSPAITFSTESPISTTKVSTTDTSITKVSTTKDSTTNVFTTDVSTTDVSTTDVSTTDDSTTDVSTTDVSTTDVSTTDVSTTDDSTTDVSTTDVSTTDVSTTDVSTTDDSTTDVSTTDDSTTDVSTTKVSTTDTSITKVSTTKVSITKVSTTDVATTNVSTTDVSTTDVSTSPTGILIPREHNKLPVPTTKSTPVTTTAPRKVSKSPPITKVQPCSNRRTVNHCLIAIASLSVLATVFMVSTIVLCTKLSKRKYKVKKPQPATEMMCISALLPERNITYSRQRNPVTNGVLVIHDDAYSDEDGGDNLTLSSFLPENDRFV